MTRGGAPHVMECVGAASSMDTAIQVARPGGKIGYVGVPHGVAEKGLNIMGLFFGNLTCAVDPLQYARTCRSSCVAFSPASWIRHPSST